MKIGYYREFATVMGEVENFEFGKIIFIVQVSEMHVEQHFADRK